MLSPDFSDACVLLGDSITQSSGPGTLCNRMTEYYERRLDVINRGFGGYTTASCLPTLTRLLSGRGLPGQRIRLLTIWLGANDAVHSPGQLHVPLAQYKQSLHELVRLVRQADDRTRVLLITPPPLLTEFWRSEHVDWALRQGGARSAEEALRVINRDADTTKSYGQAVLMVGKEAGVDVVDLMSAMPQAVGGDTEDLLRPLFTDGLHLTSEGYRVVFDQIMVLIENKYPDLDPTKMLGSMPDPSEFETSDIGTSIDSSQRRYREQYK